MHWKEYNNFTKLYILWGIGGKFLRVTVATRVKHQDLYVRGTSILNRRSYVIIVDEIRVRYDCVIKIT